MKRTESQIKYDKKTYKHYVFSLRKIEDADVIEFIEQEKQKGISITDIIRKFIRGEYESEDDIDNT